MSANYKIIGEDGREYGWVTAAQIRQWIAEQRVERQTPIFVDGTNDWSFIGLVPEFAECFAPGSAPATIAPPKPGTGGAGQSSKTNNFALWGMVFGILSLTMACCCYGFPFNILGVIFSSIGLSQIKRDPLNSVGRGMALAGLILSIASLALGVLLVLLGLAISLPAHLANFKNF
jgi:hypothetical protein